MEYRLLRTLLLAPARVLARARLREAIHVDLRDVSDRAIDSHIKNLRRNLQAALQAEAPGHDCISTVYGSGYRFEHPPCACLEP